jgi:hypothetical protein
VLPCRPMRFEQRVPFFLISFLFLKESDASKNRCLRVLELRYQFTKSPINLTLELR